MSIAAQQVVFLGAFGLRIPLIGISTWVIYVPVLIVWVLYAVVPLLMPLSSRRDQRLRCYALHGWLFVAAAVAWTVSYLVLSKLFGTPIGHDSV